MKVTLNPAISSNRFGKMFTKQNKYVTNNYTKPPTEDEIRTARTKKVLSYARYIVLLAGVLYFVIKKSIHDSTDKALADALNRKKLKHTPKPVIDARIK